MVVIPRAKALALNLRNPAPVLATIPTARKWERIGEGAIVVPHRDDEVRVLRNLGIDAPSPILYHYEWQGRFKPFAHQRDTAAFLTYHDRAIVLNDLGTGKTQSALWAADYLMRTGAVRKCLILSPLSTLERVWGDSIFTSFPDRRFVVLHGSAQRRLKLLAQDVDFYVINHDGFQIIAEDALNKFDLIIVDEAAVLRNPSTKRFKLFRNWLRNHNTPPRLWLMTGTPTPNEPTDAWALANLVGNTTYRTWGAFRDATMDKVSQWRWVPKKNAMDTVFDTLQPAVRYTRGDCFDLPETIVQYREAEMSAEQAKQYKAMLRNYVAEAKEGTITAANEAVKLNKLVQAACGCMYTDEGAVAKLDCAKRIAVVKEVIEEAGEKVIVFAPLTAVIGMLAEELGKEWSVAVVDGSVSANARNRIFHDFQNSTEPRVLVAHPGTMAHGLTLTAATTIIWYAPTNSNEIYTQANGRIERPGKTKTSNVVHIMATDLEGQIYARLRSKQKLQGLLLDMVQSTTQQQTTTNVKGVVQ